MQQNLIPTERCPLPQNASPANSDKTGDVSGTRYDNSIFRFLREGAHLLCCINYLGHTRFQLIECTKKNTLIIASE